MKATLQEDVIGGMMAKKYALIGQEAGAANLPVTKQLTTYEGEYLVVDETFVVLRDDQNSNVAVIRLAEGQSVKRIE